MTELIRKLAEQAGIDFFNSTDPEYSGRVYCEGWTEQQQKFAELIVQECVNRLRQEGRLAEVQLVASPYSTYKLAAMNEAANILNQHFGVN